MTLPASGIISLSHFDTEVGRAANANIDIGWIKANAKAGQVFNDLASYRGRAWYQRNADGNCNNGNCNCNCNCGSDACAQCTISAINCANCDTRAWIQSNCNCACTYQCSGVANITYNCNCSTDT